MIYFENQTSKFNLYSFVAESSSAGKSGGCFPGRSIVRTEEGLNKTLDNLNLGDRIAALDSTGSIVYSEVIAFLDRSPYERRQFVRLSTSSGRSLTLTPSHLVPVSLKSGRTTEFAAKVIVGDHILVHIGNNRSNEILRWDIVVSTSLVLDDGIFAPLTTEGTVIIDDVVASCYAVVDSQVVAHYAFLPMRIWTNLKSGVNRIARIFVGPLSAWSESNRGSNEGYQKGVHWYASMLYTVSFYVLPTGMLY